VGENRDQSAGADLKQGLGDSRRHDGDGHLDQYRTAIADSRQLVGDFEHMLRREVDLGAREYF